MDRYQIMITPKAKDDIIDIGDYISFILLEPSRRLYSVWVCKCTNDIAIPPHLDLL